VCAAHGIDTCSPIWTLSSKSTDAAVIDAAVEGDKVWMTCTCGARIVRDADRD